MLNLTCNSTLEELRISPTSEIPIAGPLTFHQLALIIAAACTLVAILMSFYLIMMHALHYTKPREQKHIIRILFMVPVYATASFLSLRYYWHAIYFQVISDCYEAFAISSFFALLCHYVAPDLHEQKEYFRLLHPIKPWVWPLSWFRKCCGGERGPWRTPRSGLTWFNIVWIGIYHYCFIRVAMTITSVVTEYFRRYCESSNSPAFAHIWVTVIDATAVTIAMFCIVQFYVQLRGALSEHSPFLKVLAIKLVIFLSFWQSAAISVGTSTLNIVHPNEVIAYPDLKVGVPSLLLCFEMACFSILHLWAFPYRPYLDNAKPTYYPVADSSSRIPPRENEHVKRAGGPLGIRALWDAVNIWDVVKAFGRGIRWLFVGVKHRREDMSYQNAIRKNSASVATSAGVDMSDLSPRKESSRQYAGNSGFAGVDTSYGSPPGRRQLGMPQPGVGAKSTDHLPIANEFRRSRYGGLDLDLVPGRISEEGSGSPPERDHKREEAEGLIAHAQPNPHAPVTSGAVKFTEADNRQQRSPYRDDRGRDSEDHQTEVYYYQPQQQPPPRPQRQQEFYYHPETEAEPAAYDRPSSLSTVEEESYSTAGSVRGHSHGYGSGQFSYPGRRNDPRNSTQMTVVAALWGEQEREPSGRGRGRGR